MSHALFSGLFAGIDALAAQKTAASFEALAGLVIKHFADEEKVKALPAAHLKAHHDLLAVATAKLAALKAGTEKVDDGLVHYLQNWLKNHIKSTDIPDYGK